MIAQTMLRTVPAGVTQWIARGGDPLARRLNALVFRQAQRRALRAFADQQPLWAESLFDQHFLDGAASPLLRHWRDAGLPPTAMELAAAWHAQLGGRGEIRAFPETIAAAARFIALLDRELGALRPAPARAAAPALPAPPATPSALLAEALRDPSNLELDWLWLAGQVAGPAERRYCAERALSINPASEAARRLMELGEGA